MAETITLRTGGGVEVEVVDGTERDVKPPKCGMADESWLIGRCPDGRWVALSDAADQDPAYFASEREAEAFWEQAAECE